MTQIIPETDNVEVAMIAAALHLVGNPGNDMDQNLKRFAEAYRIVTEARSVKGAVNVEKILKDLRAKQA